MFKESILDYKVNTFSVDECVEHVFKSLISGERTWLACFNPHSYTVAMKDKVFAHALKNADWLVLDGVGVVLESRILGGTI
jgi:N-acetylglucosaminyldiphosphoundecaprenol N-acetyl-beta-D-mannosaminyltransferase